MAKENGTTVSAVYKRTVWTADNTGLREGSGRGCGKHKELTY